MFVLAASTDHTTSRQSSMDPSTPAEVFQHAYEQVVDLSQLPEDFEFDADTIRVLDSMDWDALITDADKLKQPTFEPEQSTTGIGHAGAQSTETQHDTAPGYFANRGKFTEEEKRILQQYSHEPPSELLERLQEQNPSTTHTYAEVKGALENERRKQRRREENGPWTQQEVEMIAKNMTSTPTQVVSLLQNQVQGFAKNVDQVRDMKSQIAQRTKRRGKKG